ncbi:hypothetical protein D9M68_999920 [compost metagenome]
MNSDGCTSNGNALLHGEQRLVDARRFTCIGLGHVGQTAEGRLGRRQLDELAVLLDGGQRLLMLTLDVKLLGIPFLIEVRAVLAILRQHFQLGRVPLFQFFLGIVDLH